MKVTQEMYSELFNAITDAQQRLMEAKKGVLSAEMILREAQIKVENLYIGEE